MKPDEASLYAFVCLFKLSSESNMRTILQVGIGSVDEGVVANTAIRQIVEAI